MGFLFGSALSHVTQHSSHKNRKPQKQTVHLLSYSSTLHFPFKKHITILQSSTNCKKAFPHPPVIAYKRNASLRDLLVHSELPETSHLINNLLVFINATTHVASLSHCSKKSKPLTLFSPPNKHVKLLTTYLAIPKTSST